MSPGRTLVPAPPRIAKATQRLASDAGRVVHDARVRRAWRLEDLAAKARVSVSAVQGIESGRVASVETYVRLADALGLDARLTFGSTPTRAVPDADPVHAAMGEIEAAHLRSLGYEVFLDEPYQHYQFAGRADVVAVARAERAMLHLENRTRFPDMQSFIGSYNAKRAYLAAEIAHRTGLTGSFRSVDHVVVAVWSSEVLHALRLREESFRVVCPDGLERFEAWWRGQLAPDRSGPPACSSLLVFDPLTGQRSSRRRWIGLEHVRRVEPRYRDYADVLGALRASGMAR